VFGLAKAAGATQSRGQTTMSRLFHQLPRLSSVNFPGLLFENDCAFVILLLNTDGFLFFKNTEGALALMFYLRFRAHDLPGNLAKLVAWGADIFRTCLHDLNGPQKTPPKNSTSFINWRSFQPAVFFLPSTVSVPSHSWKTCAFRDWKDD